jgi:iron complex outermembrane receptor protein
MKSKLNKTALYLTTALSLGAAAPAMAQTDPAASAATVMPDIIVTARRKEEKLQDVPISMTVYNQQQLTDRNIVSSAGLAAYTPSVTANTRFGSESSTFAIRGFSQEIRTTASVAVYFADVVAPRSATSLSSGDGAGPGAFFDLQNVQVLKGPQGTLFGRNTTAGAVLLVPQKPTDRLEGYVEGSYGNYDMKRVQAVLNVPLSDWARLRLGIDHDQRDGYLKNISGVGPSRLADINYTAGRASLVLDLTPHLENYTIGSYTLSDNNGPVGRISQCFPQTRFPLGVLSCGAVARMAGKDFYAAWNGLVDPTSQMRQWQIINTTTWHASDALTVKNILSYGQLKNINRSDLTGANFILGSQLGPVPTGAFAGARIPFFAIRSATGLPTADESTLTEELQAQGRALDDRLTWQGGLYFESNQPLSSRNGTQTPSLLACTDPANFQCTDAIGTVFGVPGRLGSMSYGVMSTSYRDIGVYGQGTYELTDKLQLTAGLRYTADRTQSTAENLVYRFFRPNTPTGFCLNPLIRNPALPVTSTSDCTEHFNVKSDAPTWVLNLDYKPTNDVMLYGKYSRGYRMGSTNPAGAPGYTTFGPEKVDAYEVGAKTTFRGPVPGRFNVAAFWNDLSNQQLQVGFLSSTNAVAGNTGILNVGKSRIYGLELEGMIQPVEGVTLDAGYSYIESNIAKVNPVTFLPGSVYDTAILVPQGGRMPGSPKHKATLTAEYQLPVSEDVGRVSVAATYTFTSSQVASYTPFWGILKATELLNLNLDWKQVAGHPVDLSLFATNVAGAKYNTWINEFVSSGFVAYQRGEPRMYGVRLRYRFGS